MSAYIASRYSQRVLGKWKPFELAQWKRRAPRWTPGCMLDTDRRRFRFDKWCKRPQAAIALYHRVRQLFRRK